MTHFTAFKSFFLGKKILAIRFIILARTTLIAFLLHEFLDHQSNIIIGASLTITIMIIIIRDLSLECHNLLVFMEIIMKFLRLLKDVESELHPRLSKE
jgi:hypothetical protein